MPNPRLGVPPLLLLALFGCLGPNNPSIGTQASPSPTPPAFQSAAPVVFPSVSPLPYLAPPPWLAPYDAASRIKAAQLDQMSQEGQALHIHAHLDVFYQGQPVTVPGGIGVDANHTFISPLHTHDTSGILHIEATKLQNLTLGQFFTEWNVDLAHATATVDGVATSDPANIALHDHQEIAVVFGSPPAVIPSTYTDGWPGSTTPVASP